MADQVTSTSDVDPAPGPRRGRAPRRVIGLVVLGLLTAAGAAGTFASFTASTSNSSTFATGTIVLSDKVNTGTTCVSVTGGNTDVNANDCDALVTIDAQRPGATATTSAVVLKNVGSIGAATFHAYASQACATDDAPGTTYHGTGDLCPLVQLTIQAYADQAALDGNDPTGGTCIYGVDASPADGVCDGYSSTRTLAHFSTTYPSFGSPLDLSGLGAGVSRFYRVGVQLDAGAGNTVQGRRATFGITWRLAQ